MDTQREPARPCSINRMGDVSPAQGEDGTFLAKGRSGDLYHGCGFLMNSITQPPVLT